MQLLENSVADSGKYHAEPIWFFVVWSLEKNSFLIYFFGCPIENFRLLSRGQPLLPNVNHCVLAFLTRRLSGASLNKK